MNDLDFARLIGYLHAMDRGMQLYLTKVNIKELFELYLTRALVANW